MFSCKICGKTQSLTNSLEKCSNGCELLGIGVELVYDGTKFLVTRIPTGCPVPAGTPDYGYYLNGDTNDGRSSSEIPLKDVVEAYRKLGSSNILGFLPVWTWNLEEGEIVPEATLAFTRIK